MATPSSNSPSDKSADLSAIQLGDFLLLRQLGVGGMAEVYLAEQISLGRMVAVKILRDDTVTGSNSVLLRRFEQEARAAGGLSHPNIVQVYMIGHQNDLHYIVQEYVQGQNLSQWFKRNGPPDYRLGLKWMKQVAVALKAASDAGIVHRDIKPENIMLTRSEDAKVTDFGLAQLNEKNEKLNLTQAGTTMGTPWYMSPEQIQGEQLDHRTDQYSFGVTCYHMFAGQPPFPGKNSVSVAVQHLKDNPKPLREHRRDLPDSLCRIIHRMMEKKPEDRFQTNEDLLAALDALEDGVLDPALYIGDSAWSWFRASLPSIPFMLIGVLVCCILGMGFGRRVFDVPKIVVEEPGFPRQETAAMQFAKAIVDPSNVAAWKAVLKHYPRTDEALWAHVQLGVSLLNRQTPDLDQANAAFVDLCKAVVLDRSTHRDLMFLGLLGQAYVAEQKSDTERWHKIVYEQLSPEFPEKLQQGELEVSGAPALLREYRERLIQQIGEARQ
ncbi:MAG: serine/threonine-protein kinase [Fuerstiella sp.]